MGKLGCLVLLVAVGIMAGEVWFTLSLAEWISPGNPEYLGAFLGAVVLSVIGLQLMRARARRFTQAMMEGRHGPAMVGIVGAGLITLPGYLSGVLGLALQLPILQRAFGALAAALLLAQMRKMAGGMGGPGGMPGGMGGMPGGMGGMPGGFPGGGFPGGPPRPEAGGGGLRPDAKARGGKVVDTTAERIDE